MLSQLWAQTAYILFLYALPNLDLSPSVSEMLHLSVLCSVFFPPSSHVLVGVGSMHTHCSPTIIAEAQCREARHCIMHVEEAEAEGHLILGAVPWS